MSDFMSQVTSQAPVPLAGGGGIQSLKDLMDPSKVNPASVNASMKSSMEGLSSKLAGMNASFKSPAAASELFKNMEVPNVPALNSFAPSLNGLMGNLDSTIKSMTGTGSGALGLPNMQDFMGAVTGSGPEITNLLSSASSITAAQISAVGDMVTKASGLFSTAGIDLDTPPNVTNGSIKAFAMSLHTIGARDPDSAEMLKSLATNDAYGDAIKASLAEGKNKSLFASVGINPLSFSNQNPFAGLPSDPSNTASQDAAKLLGGS